MYKPEEDIPSETNRKIVVIDFDTPIIAGSLACQENYILVKHKETDWEKEFKNVTTFYGRKRSKDGGWIGEQNTKRQETGQPSINVDDFTIQPMSRIVEEDYVGFGRVNKILDAIITLPWVEDYIILVGGSGNFRNDIADSTEYKANRPPKPLRFKQIKDYVLKKYKNKVIQEDEVEADDVLGWYAHKGVQISKDTGKNPYVLAFVDKDLYQFEGWVLNYNKDELVVEYNTAFDAAHHFFVQMLTGDTTDCIIGLPSFTDEIREKYKLKKGRGVGAVTAATYLSDCKTIKEMAERVHEAYLSYYGDKPFEFETWRGDKVEKTYLDMLDEQSILLRMQSFKGHKYKITDTLKSLGVIDGKD